MKVLNDLRCKVAKTRHATKHLHNQFTKRNMGTYDQGIAHQKTSAQLAYKPMSNQTKYNQVLHGTGYQLDPSNEQ